MVAGTLSASTLEKRYVHKNGAAVWCSLTLTLLVDDVGAPYQFVGIVEDIDERRRSADKLRESESLLRLAGQTAHLGGWTYYYGSGEIVWSDEACAIFEVAAGAMPALAEALAFYRPGSIERVASAVERSQQTGDGFDLELEIETALGAHRWVRVIGQAEPERGRLIGGIQDITARKESELELVRMNRSLKMLSGCNEVLVRATGEAQLLADICTLAVEVGGYMMAWAGYARDDAERTIVPIVSAGDDEGYVANLLVSWDENQPGGNGIAGISVRTGRCFVFADLANNAAFAPWRRAALERGFRSVVSVPLRDGGRTFGVLCMYAGVVHAPPQAELDLLQELADDLAFGIRHLRTRAEQQRVQDAVLKIASAVSVRVSTSFFERLVSSLAEAVGASAAFIVRAHPKCASQRRTIVAVVDGVTLENFDFDAAGTPCDDVGPDGPFVVPARLPSRYDDCEMVKLSSAQALLGWRLDDAAGTQLATMFVLFREPLAELDFMTSTLQIFVTRAAAELERQIADTRIADQAAWLDRARDAIVVRDLNGSISFWNEGAERLYGRSSVEMCGTPRGAAFFNDTGRSHDVTSDVVIDGYWNGDVEHMRKDGTIVWVESRSTIVTDDDGEPRSILSIDTDITQRNAAEREIEHLAFYDALTNLPNRLMLVKGLQAALATCAGYGSLLFIDVDNFKTLNDTLGHDKGDLLLRQVALRLQACVGASDIVARFGGDEFVVVFDGLGGVHDGARETARAISKKILATFNAPFQLDGYEHTSTSSIGVTLFTSADNVDDLLKQADLAMYQAKAAGRNSLRFFDPQMQATVTLRRALENDLRTAIGANAFAVAYQPQVDSRGSVIGAEALVRWSHSRRGPVSPAELFRLPRILG